MQKANGFTRHEIMTTIKLNGSMTADALGKSLGISPVAVRQHLAALEAEGLVATSVERRSVGRPVHRYTITTQGDETFPRGYDTLANSLLDELRFSRGEEAVSDLFGLRRERMRTAYRPRMEDKSFTAQVQEVAKIQTENGFMASVREEGEGCFVLTEHNCSVCQIARNHSSVCDQELTLFRQLLGEGAVVERTQHMMRGDHTCTYVIRKKK